MAPKRQAASKSASKPAAKKKVAPVLSPEEQRLQDAYERRNALRRLQGIEPQ